MSNVIQQFQDSATRYSGQVQVPTATGGAPNPLLGAIRQFNQQRVQQRNEEVMGMAAQAGARQQLGADASTTPAVPQMAQRFQQAYEQGARAVRKTQFDNDATAMLAQIQRETQDPNEIAAKWAEYTQGYLQNVEGDPQFQMEAQLKLESMGTQAQVRALDREYEQNLRRQLADAQEAMNQRIASASDALLAEPDQEALFDQLAGIREDLEAQAQAGLINPEQVERQYQAANTALTTEWLFGTFQQRLEDNDLQGAVALVTQLDQEGMYFDDNEDARRLAARLRQRLPDPQGGMEQSVGASLDVLRRQYAHAEDGGQVDTALADQALATIMAAGTDNQRRDALGLLQSRYEIQEYDKIEPTLSLAGLDEIEEFMDAEGHLLMSVPGANALRARIKRRRDLIRDAQGGDYLSVAGWKYSDVLNATPEDLQGRRKQAAVALSMPEEMMPVLRPAEIGQLAKDYQSAAESGDFEVADRAVNTLFNAYQDNPSGLANAVIQSGNPGLAVQVMVSNMGSPGDALALRQAASIARQEGAPRLLSADDIRTDSDLMPIIRAMGMNDPVLVAGLVNEIQTAGNGLAFQAQFGGEASDRAAKKRGLEQVKSLLSGSGTDVVTLDSGAVIPGFMLTDSPQGRRETTSKINEIMSDPMTFGFGARDDDMVGLYISPAPRGNGVIGFMNSRTGAWANDPRNPTEPLTVDSIELSPPPGEEPDTRSMLRRSIDRVNEYFAERPQTQAVNQAKMFYPNTAPVLERFGFATQAAGQSLPHGADPMFAFNREAAYEAVGDTAFERIDRVSIPTPIRAPGAPDQATRHMAPMNAGIIGAAYWNHVSAKYDTPLPAMYAYVMGEDVVDALNDGQPGWYKEIPDPNVHAMVQRLLQAMEGTSGE